MYSDVQGTEGHSGSFEENVFRTELSGFHELWISRQRARDARISMREFVDAIQESDAAQGKNLSGEGIRFVLNPPPDRVQETVTAEILEAFLHGHFNAGAFEDEQEYEHWRVRLHEARLCQDGKKAARRMFPMNPNLQVEFADYICHFVDDERRKGSNLWAIEGMILQQFLNYIDPHGQYGSTYVREWIEGSARFIHYVSDTYLLGAVPAMLHLVEGLFQDEGASKTPDEELFVVGPLTLAVLEKPDKKTAFCRLTLRDADATPVGAWLYRRQDVDPGSQSADPALKLERAFLFSGAEDGERHFIAPLHEGGDGLAWQLQVRSLRPQLS